MEMRCLRRWQHLCTGAADTSDTALNDDLGRPYTRRVVVRVVVVTRHQAGDTTRRDAMNGDGVAKGFSVAMTLSMFVASSRCPAEPAGTCHPIYCLRRWRHLAAMDMPLTDDRPTVGGDARSR